MTTPEPERCQVVQITTPQVFDAYQAALAQLIAPYADTLMDEATFQHYCHDLSLSASYTDPITLLLNNLRDTIPHLWLGVDHHHTLLTACSLTDCIPGRHAFIHGITRPGLRRHPIVNLTAHTVFDYAFQQLHVLKLKAQFEADNSGAKGFCHRFGFVREGYFKGDIIVNDELNDVVIYSLFAPEKL